MIRHTAAVLLFIAAGLLYAIGLPAIYAGDMFADMADDLEDE